MPNCRVCGKEFKASPGGSTVNCPEHRNRVVITKNEPTTRANPGKYRMGYRDGKEGKPKRSANGSYSLGHRDATEGREARF